MGKRILAIAMVALAIIVGIAQTGLADDLINAAGATFPYPIYSKWFSLYSKENSGVQLNYQSIGSGGGIRMLSNRIVEIGASDAPMTDQQMKDAPGRILHFPSVMGAVVLSYNLPGYSGHLRLTGPVIADIFMAKITKWNDPKIVALNPGANLPAIDIVAVHRSDGSGTTYIFADYLSKVSPQWASEVGKSTSLRWAGGLGGKGNEGVTAVVRQTPGAIGYVELIYALTNNIPFAQIKNRSGDWVIASVKGVTAAASAAAANMPADFRTSITNEPGADTYPISSFTYLLVYQKQTDPKTGEQVKKFLNWALHQGQQYAAPLNYAPLPAAVVALEEKQLQTIEVPK